MSFYLQKIPLFLLLNFWSSAIIIALAVNIQIHSILVLGAIPIIWSGWLFARPWVLGTAVLQFSLQTIGLIIFGMPNALSPKMMIPGIVSYIIFLVIGLVLHLLKSMMEKIRVLNKSLSEKNKELRALSFRDPLTNLHNRRYVWEFVAQQALNFTHQISAPEALLRSISVSDKVMVILLVDIDHFKQVNDHFGHDVGDKVLVQVARRIRAAVRFDDMVVRWGGEEFLVVCPLVKRENVEQLIKKILHQVRAEKMDGSGETQIPVTISLGAVLFPSLADAPKALTFEQSIALADKALYSAKTSGRNQGRLVQLSGQINEIFPASAEAEPHELEVNPAFITYSEIR